jgi:hypothetical protein
MDVAPPPASRLRMQEVGDRLIVPFRPNRSGLVFLSIWLLGWTFGGIEAWLAVTRADPGGAAFLIFWLCGWFFGECAVVCIIAWKLFGHVWLAVTPGELEERSQLGRFSQTKRYEAASVGGITAARKPQGEDGLSKDYKLRLLYDGRTVWLGEGMGEREADYVAAVVLERIRGRSWWGDEERARPRIEHERAPLEMGVSRRARAFAFFGVPLAFVGIIGSALVVRFGRHASPRRTTETVRSEPFPPSRKDFSNPREYAAAMTAWALSSGRSELVSRPRCDARSTWTHWSCHALARSDWLPKSAGLAVAFRCESVSIGGVKCGLAMRGPPTPLNDS